MPKRKRSANEDDGNRGSKRRADDVQAKLLQSKKLLHRALKTAKGFERQKLGKRLTKATADKKTDEIARINREIEALKDLKLDQLTDAHLYKTLLRVKSFAESELLPEEVKKAASKPEGPEEMLIAIQNVKSGMCNTKTVKDTMQQIVDTMYIALGIRKPSAVGKTTPTAKDTTVVKPVKSILISRKAGSNETVENVTVSGGSEDDSFEGFDSEEEGSSAGTEDGEAEDGEAEDGEAEDGEAEAGDESMDEDALAHFDALLGADSDEESFDEEEYKKKHPKLEQRLSLSLSPEPSDPSESHALSQSPSLSPEPQPKPPKAPKSTKSKPAPAPMKAGSTFLPTLMGGYWSGSEESASDLDEEDKPVKKNRPGQAARRAIWEKKYGEKAVHIKEGKGPGAQPKKKDDGWDAKRGAKDSSNRGRGRGDGVRRGPSRDAAKSFSSGENAIAVAPKPRGMGKKDDVGVLHPSWQAAKKAKEQKKTAKFEGKKVTFN